MNEREFWLQIRRALFTFLDAIERRYEVGKYEPGEKSLNSPPARGR